MSGSTRQEAMDIAPARAVPLHRRGLSSTTAASLASTLSVLAEARETHAGEPARFQAVVDRMSFRVLCVEDLFRFAPSSTPGEVPPGGGTLWGFICESEPLPAGILIRRFWVERQPGEMGHDASEKLVDALMFALDEYPENVALFEMVSRIPEVRACYGRREDGLSHALNAMRVLRDAVGQLPEDILETDRACVGTTSGVYGVVDGDAFFTEADIFRSILEVLLSTECQHWPRGAGNEAVGALLRELCVVIADVSGMLQAHPRVQMRALAFLSSATPFAFTHAGPGDLPEAWTFLHMFLTSDSSTFLLDALTACCGSRLHDTSDLLEVHDRLVGHVRPADGRRALRQTPGDVKLMFCRAMLQLFHTMEILLLSQQEMDRFAAKAATLFRDRFLAVLQTALDGPLASRWREVREALEALVAVAERAPAASELESLRGARSSFRTFALARFLLREGNSTAEVAEVELDPFGRFGASHSSTQTQGSSWPMEPIAPLAVLRWQPETASAAAGAGGRGTSRSLPPVSGICSARGTPCEAALAALPARSGLCNSARGGASGEALLASFPAHTGLCNTARGASSGEALFAPRSAHTGPCNSARGASAHGCASGSPAADFPDPHRPPLRPLSSARAGLARRGLPPLPGKARGFSHTAPAAESAY